MMNMSEIVFFDCYWNNDVKYIYKLIDIRFIDMIEINKKLIVCM